MVAIDVGILVLRVLLGLLFFGHGAQKLFGWFGGHGIDGTTQFFQQLGFRPPKPWAIIAGLGEFLGGIGLALGLFTPIAAAAIVGVMLMAIVSVHWEHGVWSTDNGFEYPLVNLVLAAFLGLFGANQYALDTLLNIAYPMPTTFYVALTIAVLGVIAGLVSTQMGGPQQMGEAQSA